MKLSHLLVGAAASALLAGTASAQQLTATLGGKTSVSGTTTVNATAATVDNLATRVFVASEVNTTGAAGVGTLSGQIVAPTAVAWDGLGAARVTISLSGAVFNAPVAATSLVCPTAAAATVFSGGNAGQSSVTFLVNDIALCDGDLVTFSGIFVAVGAGSVDVSASLERVSTSLPIGSTVSTAGTSGAFIQRVSGIRVARAALNTPVVEATAQLPGYTTLTANAPSLNIRVGHALIGTAGGGTAAGTSVQVNKNMTAGVFDEADIAGTTIPVVITVPSPAGLNTTTSGATLGAAAAATSVAGVLTYNVDKTGVTASGGKDLAFVIVPSTTTPAPIAAQTITAQGSVSLATSATPTQLTPFSQSAVNLLTIARAGSSSNIMRWVGDGVTTSAISVFRLTGIPAAVPTIRFTLSNATNGTSFNGEYTVPASAITRSAGGEVVLSSLTLQSLAGSFGRGDVVITVEATGIRTQRFVQAPNGTLAPAPENGNATPNNN